MSQQSEAEGPQKPQVEWPDMTVGELIEEGRAIFDRQRGSNGRESDALANALARYPALDLRAMRSTLDDHEAAEKTQHERRMNHIRTIRNAIHNALGR